MLVLGVSRQRVYQLIGLGRLPSRKEGNRIWIPQNAIQDRIAGEQRLGSNQCVTTQEVADFFGVNERTVRAWHDAGLIRALMINNQLCFAPTDIIKFAPPYNAGAGRPPKRAATRTLRGRYYPPSPRRRT